MKRRSNTAHMPPAPPADGAHYRAARYGLTRTGLSPVGLRQLLLAPSEIQEILARPFRRQCRTIPLWITTRAGQKASRGMSFCCKASLFQASPTIGIAALSPVRTDPARQGAALATQCTSFSDEEVRP